MGGDRAVIAQQASGRAARRDDPAGPERDFFIPAAQSGPAHRGGTCRRYGPYTTAYNRYNRWRKAGVWDRLLAGLAQAGLDDTRMIDTSTVRVHLHAGSAKKGALSIVTWDVPEAD